MAAQPIPDGPAMTSPETGEPLARGVRPFTVTYKGHSITVDLPGWYPEETARACLWAMTWRRPIRPCAC